MQAQPNPKTARVETVTAALIYLMTHYARTGCPRLALCVSRHMQCLASHPDAPRRAARHLRQPARRLVARRCPAAPEKASALRWPTARRSHFRPRALRSAPASPWPSRLHAVVGARC